MNVQDLSKTWMLYQPQYHRHFLVSSSLRERDSTLVLLLPINACHPNHQTRKGTYIVLSHVLLLLVPAYSVLQAVLLLLSFRQGQSGRKTSTEVIPTSQQPSIQRGKRNITDLGLSLVLSCRRPSMSNVDTH